MNILDRAILDHRPSHVFALFSGGHDSLCATHVASQHPSFSGAVHINTGTGIPETREFVIDTCKEYGWPLLEYRPPVAYEDLVMKHGFPGPGGHRYMYANLKERALRQLVREHKASWYDRIGLVTGVRSQESLRRMGTVEPIKREGAQLWIAVIHDWTKQDCNAYMAANDLPRNSVVDLLHMSAECLCGSYARKGERDEIAFWYPDVAQRIGDLESKARDAGLKRCIWGDSHPKEQIQPGPLCSSCAR